MCPVEIPLVYINTDEGKRSEEEYTHKGNGVEKNTHTRETEWRRIHTHMGVKKNTHTRETEWRRRHIQSKRSGEEYTHKGE